MTVIELDDARHSLRLSKKHVCLQAGINQSTYQRWLKWARGEPDGCQPHPRSIRALRDVLQAEFSQEEARQQTPPSLAAGKPEQAQEPAFSGKPGRAA